MITRGTTISGNLHIQPNCIKLQRKRNREDPLRNLLAHVGPRKNSGRGRLLFQSQSLGHWHSRVEGPASPCHAKPPRHVEFETHRSGFHLWYIAYTVLTGLISGRSWNIIWTFPKVQKWMLWSAYIITIYHISYYISLPNIIQQHLSSEKKSGDLCGWSIGGGEVGSATFLHLRWGPRRDLHATGGGPGWDFFGGWDCSLSCGNHIFLPYFYDFYQKS